MSGVKDFSGFEVITAAMEVERNGQRFYNTMKDQANTALAREIFTTLAQDEVKHLATLKELEPTYRDGEFWANEEEFIPYLQQFNTAEIFPSPDRLAGVLAGEDSDLVALDLAIEAEEKFAAYFQKAAEQALSADGKKAFAWLAQEEERHALILKERRNQIVGG